MNVTRFNLANAIFDKAVNNRLNVKTAGEVHSSEGSTNDAGATQGGI